MHNQININLFMHGSPCQDFSLAGLRAGGDEGSGTRSSLMYETLRIVEKLKPKYVIWENVKNIISKKHVHNFNNYINRMSELGYKSFYKVLNAKDYGIPQNRERVFTVSILDGSDYEFPKPMPLKLKLKDMLEDEVNEKYYLSDKMIQYISARGTENFKNSDSRINLDIARPITTDPNKRAGTTNYLSDKLPSNYDLSMKIKNATKKGYLEATAGDGVDISSRMKYHRGTVQKESAQTIVTKCNIGVVVKGGKQLNETIEKNIDKFKEGKVLNMDLYNRSINEELSQTLTDPNHNSQRLFDGLRIRKLTPKECWRLMGFDDSDFDKASKVNSNTQLYKQAGNSIIVNVLYYILKELLKGGHKE